MLYKGCNFKNFKDINTMDPLSIYGITRAMCVREKATGNVICVGKYHSGGVDALMYSNALNRNALMEGQTFEDVERTLNEMIEAGTHEHGF